MKRNLIQIVAASTMLLAVFSSCKDKDVAVNGISLNTSSCLLGIGDEATLTATVNPSDADNTGVTWNSDNGAVATVANGVVTAVDTGSAIITVTTDDGQFKATCKVTVGVIGKPAFKTDKVWTIGEQTWSDAVVATGCDKETFDGGAQYTVPYKVDCRKSGEGQGHLFSWEAVSQYQEYLCPDEWRVPAKEDFQALDIALGGNGENGQNIGADEVTARYINTWGGEYGGFASGAVLNQQGTGAFYWSQTVYLVGGTYEAQNRLNFSDQGMVQAIGMGGMRQMGHSLRCVK